jgi:TRAP-type C4-dicarboxylate transport system substrate-binding protein
LPAIAALWLGTAGTADAQQKLTITVVTQPFGTQPQFTKVDQPILRDGLKAKSNGQIDVKLSAWPEMGLNGPEVLRLVRAGQVDIGAAPLSTVSGDVPFLDGIDLAGLHPDIDQARKAAVALMPLANKELEKFGSQHRGLSLPSTSDLVSPAGLQPCRPQGPKDPHLRRLAQ